MKTLRTQRFSRQCCDFSQFLGSVLNELREDLGMLNTNGRLNAGLKTYLDDGRVLRERACWFGWLTHSQILDIAASEDDVLKDIISSKDGSVSGAVLGPKGSN